MLHFMTLGSQNIHVKYPTAQILWGDALTPTI